MNKVSAANKINELKIPPYSEEAEQAVLGSVLIDKDVILKVYDLLVPEDFYYEKHQMVWRVMLDHYSQHLPIDLLTLSNSLEVKGELTIVGGLSYLSELTVAVPSASHIVSYATLVKEKSTRRKMIAAGDTVMGLGYRESTPINEDLENAEKEIFKISQTFLRNKFVHIKDILTGRFELFASLHEDPDSNQVSGIQSGFTSLDEALNGFKPSDLVILAARPSMGKTAFALNIAQAAAMKYQKKVGVFSLEMSKEQLVDRLLCM
ncbi:MAG TPA: DnaB-like helicase N-terminal domain-containing protein, partial [Candidatus Gracilibacteria bacterium]|nr:DnaB-like helicase N-terminal domain-containing protein [Candidatus Gracilibacteria bacterium]